MQWMFSPGSDMNLLKSFVTTCYFSMCRHKMKLAELQNDSCQSVSHRNVQIYNLQSPPLSHLKGHSPNNRRPLKAVLIFTENCSHNLQCAHSTEIANTCASWPNNFLYLITWMPLWAFQWQQTTVHFVGRNWRNLRRVGGGRHENK